MKKILTILFLANLAHADNFTLFDVNGTDIENFRRVRSIENPSVAAGLADQVRPYEYVVPQLDQIYWKWDGSEIVAMTAGERTAKDDQLATDWVTANTKSSKQLTAETRLVQIVTNAFPAVTFPLSDQAQIDDVSDQILVKVNQNRTLYGTQANATLIGEFIADNEALSDVQAIQSYIERTWGAKVTDATFGRQVNSGDAP